MKKINLDERFQPFRDTVRSIIAKELTKRVEERGAAGMVEYAREYLDRLNVRPDFVNVEDVGFAALRNKLNTARGIMISNHPSIIDAQMLLQTLSREDFKLLVNPGLFEKAKGTRLEQYFIPAAKENISEMKKMLSAIKDHIARGGLVWIFPTGGGQIRPQESGKSRHFASGMNLILNELAADDMVYVFHIDTDDVRKVAGFLKINTAFLSGEFLPESLNIAHMRDTQKVRIGEKCMIARSWQEVAKGADKRNRNQALTKYYLQQFGIAGDELEKVSRG